MGMTYQLAFRSEKPSGARRDLSVLCRAQPQLDVLCDARSIPRISGFVDEGAAHEDLEATVGEGSLPPFEGARWFLPAVGLGTFEVLLSALRELPNSLPAPSAAPSWLSAPQGIDVPQGFLEALGQGRKVRGVGPEQMPALLDELEFVASSLRLRSADEFNLRLLP